MPALAPLPSFFTPSGVHLDWDDWLLYVLYLVIHWAYDHSFPLPSTVNLFRNYKMKYFTFCVNTCGFGRFFSQVKTLFRPVFCNNPAQNLTIRLYKILQFLWEYCFSYFKLISRNASSVKQLCTATVPLIKPQFFRIL